MAKKGKKLARKLRARIKEREKIDDKDAYRKPGGSPGNYEKVYGAKP